MKQFNDVVTYVRNGKEIPALVAASRDVNGEERLQLAYLDPDNGEVQLAVHGTVSRAYSVEPLKEGAVNGWKDGGFIIEGASLPDFVTAPFDAAMADIRADARKQIDAANEHAAQLQAKLDVMQQPPTPSEPSKFDVLLLTREQTRELVFAQLDRGETATTPNGANLADFIEALNEHIREQRPHAAATNEKVAAPEQIIGEQLQEADAVHDEIMSQEEPQTTSEAPTAEVTTQP